MSQSTATWWLPDDVRPGRQPGTAQVLAPRGDLGWVLDSWRHLGPAELL